MRDPLIDVDLRSYFVFAVETLGLSRFDAIDWLIGQTHTSAGHWRDPGTIRRQSGQEWRSTLSELGLRDPEESFDDNYFLAIKKARHDYRRAQSEPVLARRAFAGVLLVAPVPAGFCRTGEALGGRLLSAVPEFPTPGCEQRVCRCAWRLVSNYEVGSLLSSGKAVDFRSAGGGARQP